MLRLISHSWRSWNDAKGVALLSILALAIGIGSATAIFTVVNSVLLKPLPYSHSDRWVALFGGSTLGSEADGYTALSVADLIDYQQRNHSFEVFGYYNIFSDFNLSSSSLVEHVNGAEITPSLLNNVGVNPVLGHLFQEPDGPHVAMLSEQLWKRLGSSRAVIGSSIMLNGQSYTVAGVMPVWFQLPIVNVSTADVHNDVWIPVSPPTDPKQRRDSAYYAGYARLKPGVTIAQASDDVKRVAAEIVKESPGRSISYTATLFGLQHFLAKEIRPYLLLFLGAAALLLLVTCANVAGLLVARSVGRAHEIAVRIALGASKTDLALQFILEGCVISLAAGALGLIASVGLTRLILSMASQYIPRAEEVSIDGIVVLFVAGVACVTTVLPAIPPLWQALRTQPHEVLGAGVRASAGARGRRLSRSLVIGEVAFAFLMLSVSGLLISELEKLRHTWPGFDAGHLLTFQLNATDEKYSSTKELLAHQNDLLTALEALPGVRSAALANQLPLDGCCFSTTLYPEGQSQKGDFAPTVSIVIVSPGYFKTMGIPLLKGRLLTEEDTNDNPAPIVIDETAAKHYWPRQEAVGAFGRGGPDRARVQVVGVVGDVHNRGLGDATVPEIYVLDAQTPVAQMQFIVRSDLPPVSLVPAVRRAVHSVDPEHAIYAVRTMDRVAGDSLTPQRLDSIVTTFFALAAFLMASLGIYGMMSYSVRERTVEMGTRMALGGVRRDLLSLVVGDGFKMAAQGMLIGVLAALGANWLLFRFLQLHEFGVLPYASSAGLVGSVATFASVFPAWRATLVSPMVAIRNESESLWTIAWRGLEQSAVSEHVEAETAPPASTLLAGLIDASRRADSFSEALAIALFDLCEKFRTQSAMLFELGKSGDTNYRCRAASPAVSLKGAIPADGILAGRLKFHSSPLSYAADEMDAALRWARERKPQHAPEIEYLREIGLRLAVPLRTKDEVRGILLLGHPLARNQYSSADIDVLHLYAQQLALTMENARLTERALEHEKIRQDVALAAEVQDRLLPQKSIETEAITVAAFTLPARGIGGDCYDFLDLAGHGVGIALADVAGKGIAAALIMAAVQASLRIIAEEGHLSPAQLVAKLNSFLHRSTRSESYATFFYAQFDAKAQHLRYVNAGHNPPYFVRSFGSSRAAIEELKAGGTIVGMFPDSEYQEQRIDIRPGDLLLAFTDGVTDAMNPNQEAFGEERLKALVRQIADLPVPQIISRISQELRAWMRDAPQFDDLTFIVAKIKQ